MPGTSKNAGNDAYQCMSGVSVQRLVGNHEPSSELPIPSQPSGRSGGVFRFRGLKRCCVVGSDGSRYHGARRHLHSRICSLPAWLLPPCKPSKCCFPLFWARMLNVRACHGRTRQWFPGAVCKPCSCLSSRCLPSVAAFLRRTGEHGGSSTCSRWQPSQAHDTLGISACVLCFRAVCSQRPQS